MSSFTALMALSASKTQEQNNMAQRALLERQKKEQEVRKQQADREARERELEKKLRMKHFEDEKREQERRKRMEETQKAREAALQRKKDEQRDVLLYGPKKAASGKASSSSSSSGGGGGGGGGGTAPRERRRLPEDDDDDSPSGSMLTREELRERKQQAEHKRLYNSSKRPSTAHSYFKSGRRLPGGAVDIPTTQQTPGALVGRSVKDRITAMPNSLTKLNMVKRDTRTIDEIHTELQRKKEGKVLGGDEAKSFDNWFSSTKKKDPVKKVQQPDSTTGSGANTPTSSVLALPPPKKSGVPSLSSGAVKSSAMRAPIPKSSSQPIASSKPTNRSRADSLDKYGPSRASSQPTKFSKHSTADRDRERDRHAPRPATSASGPTKKRPRSESRSESPPPKRRATSMEEEGDLPGDLSSTIWSIFGRKRDRYVGMDVFSDDEDMEVDARVLEREEKFSARVAKKEDLEAIEQERRHEEEKRRRKKEKERGQR